MSDFQNFKISPANFLTIATNVLYKTLLEVPRTSSKNVFKAISDGKRVSILDVRMEDDADVRFDLALDHSEYRGGRLNFTAFRDSVTVLVAALGENLHNHTDVPGFTQQRDRSLLFGVPGVTQEQGQANALMLGVNMRGAGTVLLKLQYIDPTQFQVQEQQTS